jgi:hypothetical protein
MIEQMAPDVTRDATISNARIAPGNSLALDVLGMVDGKTRFRPRERLVIFHSNTVQKGQIFQKFSGTVVSS